MGFDHTRLPLLHHALDEHSRPLAAFGYDEVICESNDSRFAGRLCEFQGPCLAFAPHFGWKGRVEIATKDSIAEVHLVG